MQQAVTVLGSRACRRRAPRSVVRLRQRELIHEEFVAATSAEYAIPLEGVRARPSA